MLSRTRPGRQRRKGFWTKGPKRRFPISHTVDKQDLVDLLDEALIESRSDFGAPKSWRMSSLGKCLRAQVLARLAAESAPFSTTTLGLFRIGDLLEEDYLKLLDLKIPVITRTVTGKRIVAAFPEYDARGALDALIVLDGEMGPLDVKSTRDSALSYSDLPYDNHKKQVAAYALALGFIHSWLLYLGRDGAKKWFKVKAADFEQEIKKEWAELNFWWNQARDSLPDGEVGEVVLPPKKPQVQATKTVKKGGVTTKLPFVYEIDGPWGRKGDPKMELDNECVRCPYIQRCWGEASELGDSPEEGATTKSADSRLAAIDPEAASSVGVI